MNRGVIQIIKLYQRVISPLLPQACRFHPTCSRYASECFHRFGFFKALALSTKRLLRCHPFHAGGIDPVPGSGKKHSAFSIQHDS